MLNAAGANTSLVNRRNAFETNPTNPMQIERQKFTSQTPFDRLQYSIPFACD